MNLISRLLIFSLLLTSKLSAGQFVQIAGDVNLPVPDGWRLTTDTTSLPAQMVCDSVAAEILVFQSDIEEDDLITDQDQLKQSVDLVIEDVISTLPQGHLRVSTGFYEGARAGFILEFASIDTLSGVPLEHSIKGIIYRISPERQRLFTIWGKATAGQYAQVREAIHLVQDGFSYRGPQETEVFAPRSSSLWWLVPLLVSLAALLLIRSARRKSHERSRGAGA